MKHSSEGEPTPWPKWQVVARRADCASFTMEPQASGQAARRVRVVDQRRRVEDEERSRIKVHAPCAHVLHVERRLDQLVFHGRTTRAHSMTALDARRCGRHSRSARQTIRGTMERTEPALISGIHLF
eukprot:6193747-Pleurochrysis_carterae.AAC.3